MTGDGLTPKQREAIMYLAAGHTRAETAAAVGVSIRTLHGWTKRPQVAAALAEAEAQVLADVSRLVMALPERAIAVVRAVLDDPNQGARVQLRAAQIALDATLKVRELHLEKRLAALEAYFGLTGG